MKRLREDDAKALNLLLEHGENMPTATSSFGALTSEDVASRIGVVEAAARVLREWPASEPSKDLAQRTMQYISQRSVLPHTSQPDTGTGLING